MNTEEIAKYINKELDWVLMSCPFIPYKSAKVKTINIFNHVLPFIRDEAHWEEIKKLIKDENQQ